MTKRLWSFLFILLMVSGCGYSGTPTRQNDFTLLTSIQIIPVSPSIATSKTIAANTSTRLSVIGNFSGLFTRDITDQVVWSSATPTVAEFITAAQPNRVSGHTPGNAILTASVGSITANLTLTVSTSTITTLAITPANPTVSKGLTQQFTATGSFSDSTTQDLTFDSSWTSSAPTVATVGDTAINKGFAKALSIGSSTITATLGNSSSTTLLTVTEPVLLSIAVRPANTSLPANPSILSLSTTAFTATGSYSDGTTADLTALAAWTSSNTAFATVFAGTATTLAQGTTTINGTYSGVTGTSALKVNGGNLTSIAITPATPTLVVGTLTRITATGTFSNGPTRDITNVVDWTTANTAIATVTISAPRDNLAFLNALATTPATAVTASYGLITTSTNLIVTNPQLQAPLTISSASLNLNVGTSDLLTVSATYNGSPSQNITLNSTWSSDNNAVATVENTGINKGRVTGIAAGTANITATFGGLNITRSVTVTSRSLKSLAISGTSTLVSGKQAVFTTIATYIDNTTNDVTDKTTWAISSQSVAILADSLNQPGQIVGVDSGSATLTATFGGLSPTVTVTVP